MLPLIAYNLTLVALFPILLLWALWRLARGKSRRGWLQRFGLLGGVARKAVGGTPRRPRIWVHACSVGEVNAARPVIAILREQLPEAAIFLSTITPTGQAQAQRFCPEADAVFYFPLDLLPCMWLALRALKPDLCILTEKELWPNHLALCRKNGIPVVAINAIFSDTIKQRARWFPAFMRWLLGMIGFYSVQSEQDHSRALCLGVSPERIAVDGNTKFDQTVPEAGKEALLAKALGLQRGAALVVAGSTHAGEEEVVLEAFRRLRRRHPRARLVLAPRHPERAALVATAIEKSGLRWQRRSELGNGSRVSGLEAANKRNNVDSGAVIILDTVGELTCAYRLGRAAFVGGSLVAHVGGHNPLEATAEGRPAFFGPHMWSKKDIAALLCREQVGFVVKNADELAAGWQRAIEDEAWRAETERLAKETMARNRGASERAAARILDLLARQSDLRKAESAQASACPDLRRYYSTSDRSAQIKDYLLEVVEGRAKGFLPDLLRMGLTGLSYCYWGIITANLALYEARLLRRKRLPCPVISIGNLTLGGTGKTLATATLCQWLLKRQLKPAVLSRGYGGNSSVPRLVFDGERLRLKPHEAGDEPFLLAATMPEVKVLVGKDRRRSAEMALHLGAQVLLLDDGFQYWKIEKDFELLLVDALEPFGNGRLFPRGLLREPPTALRRAQAIWITHCDLVPREQLAGLEQVLRGLAPGVPIGLTAHQATALRDFTSGDRIGLWALEGKRVLALSGLGNPFSFEVLLQRLGAEVIPARFPDHHRYTAEEVLSAIRQNAGINMVVTTAKDAVRLPRELIPEAPLRILEVRLASFAETGCSGMEELIEEAFVSLAAEE